MRSVYLLVGAYRTSEASELSVYLFQLKRWPVWIWLEQDASDFMLAVFLSTAAWDHQGFEERLV